MGWTQPRLLATKRAWFDHTFDYNGPACYELGTGGPRGGRIQWHYVGETSNERVRLSCYARSGSHLSDFIEWHDNAAMQKAKNDGTLPIEDHNTRIIVYGDDPHAMRSVAEAIAQQAFHNVAFFAGNAAELGRAVK